MTTLLLRLAGPMQSWGTRSRFLDRDTDLEPSKSGVLGLVCAALGIDRSDWNGLEPLTRLRMGVRVDQPGTLRSDYHTARVGPGPKGTSVTQRYYLADAVFLVGLEGDDRGLLRRIDAALRNPRWPLYLGRKSFVPAQPVFLDPGLVEEDLETALRTYEFLGRERGDQEVRFVIESDHREGSLRMDQPIASFAARRFGARHVVSFTARLEDAHVPV